MTRRKSTKPPRVLEDLNRPANVLQNDRDGVNSDTASLYVESKVSGIDGIKSLLDDENSPQPSTSSATDSFTSDAAALYDELDSFRQRWKRELEIKKPKHGKDVEQSQPVQVVVNGRESNNENQPPISTKSCTAALKESFLATNNQQNNPKQVYALAKKLFLIGVNLEQDEMHHESIRYYKQAMHLCPDIEKQIFREQCEASARANTKATDSVQAKRNSHEQSNEKRRDDNEGEQIPLVDRIRQSYCDDLKDNKFRYCKPAHRLKAGTLHISELPHELILQICRYVIGQELDLASLESMGMVCRGFYILSKDSSLWRSICYSTWGDNILAITSNQSNENIQGRENIVKPINWRQLYLDKPRVNYDGVYISRTRYIRQGDVGFQDITYRPFHVIRYYRYLRFFPDRRVLILTTNEEPERIVPIFRHALHSKQFSSELSILEGTYEFINLSQVVIVAEKNCRLVSPPAQNQTRRQAQFQWSRQTPLAQKFNLKFELKTVENKPYRNNVLKWLEYTILTRLETGQEITAFDLSPDTFPSLIFFRVRSFNLRSTKPLFSH